MHCKCTCMCHMPVPAWRVSRGRFARRHARNVASAAAVAAAYVSSLRRRALRWRPESGVGQEDGSEHNVALGLGCARGGCSRRTHLTCMAVLMVMHGGLRNVQAAEDVLRLCHHRPRVPRRVRSVMSPARLPQLTKDERRVWWQRAAWQPWSGHHGLVHAWRERWLCSHAGWRVGRHERV